MGGNIMPMMVDRGMAQVYDFQRNEVRGRPADAGYWRDVGRWTPTTTRTWTCALWCRCSTSTTVRGRSSLPTSRRTTGEFVQDGDRVGHAVNSVVSNGVIVSGAALVRESVLSPACGWRTTPWNAR